MDIVSLIISSDAPDYTLRLLSAAIMGGVIGLDREKHDRPAGLRTHMMTAMAAAIFTILTMELHETFIEKGAHGTADPIRIVEAVTAGVAFLAAGAIIQARGEVKGLTTGAGMWLAGALGVACGTENYLLAVIALALAAIILAAIRPLESRFGERSDNQKDDVGGPSGNDTPGE
ncbi:MgtC/SapB family protein [Parvibaculum sp.]|jgi:putative Mg2+ transporter-C (MgtC) family protein|uniref:MgtC/SapB family protein n=1 Tax=Parvibaculum sp. TaxID=2024848 RepID=UPI001B1F3B6A|nr:MgtC/SapB family protein [Parvibaculum sp.]MBO6677658.1 MgtC/SapB family protein [Parvibaculum sp.]MBO6684458.1 MgtC/SapB family protein [Parvibaculum sp.]MBO6905810.1 MgtC/SapB family protein [Parvibaculum sp.]